METTVAISANQNTTGFNFARRMSVGRLVLRMSLGGLALILWQAAPVKAQECCPDQSTEAELARFQSSSMKPRNIDATKLQRGNSTASVKMGANADANKKSKMHAKSPAQEVKTAVPTTDKPLQVQKVAAAGDGKVQSQADGHGRKDTGGAASR
jgi:hypothetical protein